MADRQVSKPKEKEKVPNESLVPSRPKEGRPVLGQSNDNDVMADYKKEKKIIQNILLDKQIQEVKDKINDSSPLRARDIAAMNKENAKYQPQMSPEGPLP